MRLSQAMFLLGTSAVSAWLSATCALADVCVLSIPSGATVFVDEARVGTTSITVTSAGHARFVVVRVEKAGYQPIHRMVDLGSNEDVLLSLQPESTGEHTAKLTVKLFRLLQPHKLQVMGLAFSPDGSKIASVDAAKSVKLWDVATGRELLAVADRRTGGLSVGFSRDGQQLIIGENDGTISRVDVATGRELPPLIGHTNWVTSVSFASGAHVLASGSWDGRIKFWDVSRRECKLTVDVGEPVYCVAYSPDGRVLASGSHEKKV